MKSKFDIGSVNVTIHNSDVNKLTILKMTIENWQYNNTRTYRGVVLPLNSTEAELFKTDLHKVNELLEEGRNLIREQFLAKDDMLYLNTVFKRYDGKREK